MRSEVKNIVDIEDGKLPIDPELIDTLTNTQQHMIKDGTLIERATILRDSPLTTDFNLNGNEKLLL